MLAALGGAAQAGPKPAANRAAKNAKPAPAQPAAAATPRPATIYLNGLGGPMQGGRDDPGENRASALGTQRVAMPPFAGTADQWKEIVGCVRQGFAPFAVEVTTERPAQPGYSMIVVGGTPALIRNPDNLGGYAPVGDGAERSLVGFVFPEAVKNQTDKVCQAILHESGHLLGLDHVYSCEDPMSYFSCGTQRFLETEELCGETEPRACSYPGGTTRKAQSSALMLAKNVGWRDGIAPTPSTAPPAYLAMPVLTSLEDVMPNEADAASKRPESEDVVAAADAAQLVATARAATAAVAHLDVRGYEVQRGGDFINLYVVARSDRHVYDAALQWNSSLEKITFTCAELTAGKDPDASCQRQGNVFAFRIRAGTGQREVRALALDARNMWLLTGTAAITLTPN